MKKFIRFISLVLCITMLMSSLVFASPGDKNDPKLNSDEADNTDILESAEISNEVTGLRKSDEKHFKMNDGSFVAVKYSSPVHYMNNGTWEEIDNTLVECAVSKKREYKNKSNDFQVTFANDIQESKLVTVKYNDYQVSWEYVQNNDSDSRISDILYGNNAPAVFSKRLLNNDVDNDSTVEDKNNKTIDNALSDSSIVYSNIEPGVDLEYRLSGSVLKENFIIKSKRASYEFSLKLKTGGLIPVINGDAIDFNNGDDTIFTIPAPLMYDSNNQYSDSLGYSITNEGAYYLLTLTADAGWVNDASRVFPVTIDPEMSAKAYSGYGKHIYLQQVRSELSDAVWATACDSDVSADIYGKRRTYITVELPELHDGDVLCNATISLNAKTDCKTSDYNRINMYKLPQVYDSTALCWNNQPTVSQSDLLDYNFIDKARASGDYDNIYDYGESNTYNFDITKAAQLWYGEDLGTTQDPYSYTSPQHSLVMKFNDETGGQDNWRRFHINNQELNNETRLIISYRNAVGYEDYWNYTSIEAGYNGTASVNNYSGSLYVSQPVAGISSEIMPINISLENVKNYIGSNNVDLDGGWRLNYSMEENFDSLNSDSTCSNYFIDGDGSKHYFYIPVGQLTGYDEDGLGLKLELLQNDPNGDRAKITDQDGTVMFFNADKQLRRIQDKYNNYINIEMVANSYKFSKISNSVGQEYNFTYYPNSALLATVTDPAGQVTTFYYNNELLNRIQYPDGKNVYYTYNSYDELTSITNYDSTKTQIQYDSSVYRRVANIKRINSNNTATDSQFTFVYDFHNTTVTDKYNQSVEYQFDNFGNLTCAIDKQSGNVSTGTSGKTGIVTSSNKPNPTAHKPENLSNTLQLKPNLLNDGGFNNGISNYYGLDYNCSSYDNTVGRSNPGSLMISVPESNTWPATIGDTLIVGAGCSSVSGGVATAYVNTGGVRLENGKGAVLMFYARNLDTNSYEMVGKSQPVYYTSENEWVKLTATLATEEHYSHYYNYEFMVALGIECYDYDNNALDNYTVWFDDVSVYDTEPVAYNLIENAAFNITSGYGHSYSSSFNSWNKWSSAFETSLSPVSDTDYSVSFNGNPDSLRRVYQTLNCSGSAGDVYAFGSWGQADSVWINDYDRGQYITPDYTPTFSVEVTFYSGSSIVGSTTVDFNPYIDEWQYVGGTAVATGNYTSIRYCYEYDYNLNTVASFKWPFITKDVTSEFYQYDSDGNLISLKDQDGAEITADYDGNLPTQIEADGKTSSISYNSNNDISKVTDDNDIETKYSYNSHGQIVKSTTYECDLSTAVQSVERYQCYNIISAYDYKTLLHNNLEFTGVYDYTNHFTSWFFQSAYEDYLYITYDEYYTDCITVSTGQSTDTSMFERDSGYYGNQAFLIIDGPNGTVKFQNSGTQKFLTRGAVDLTAEPANDSLNQQWYLIPVDTYKMHKAYDSTSNSTSYSDDGSHVVGETDALGNSVSYQYYTSGANKYLLSGVTDSLNNTVQYSYDSQRRLAGISSDGSWINYGYDANNRLTSISKNKAAGSNASLTYKLEYDQFGKQTAWKLQNSSGSERTIESYTYNNNDLLSNVAYGNGQSVNYGYNSSRQLISILSGGVNSSFTYDAIGRHVQTTDNINSINTFYTYNTSGEVTSSSQYKLGISEPWLHTAVETDTYGKTVSLFEQAYRVGAHTTSYLYGNGTTRDSSKIYELALDGEKKLEYGYGTFGWKTSRTLFLSPSISRQTTYEFLQKSDTGEYSSLIKSMTNAGGKKYDYTYDANGNITAITNRPANGGNPYTTSYVYDAKGQLTQSTDTESSRRYNYAYDKSGNIISKQEYDLSSNLLDSISCVYDDEDKLVNYDGQTLTYDLSGNPLNYRDGMTMTWNSGRQLGSITKNGTTSTYAYNENGMRTYKYSGGHLTEYIMSGDRLVALILNDYNIMYFMYDDNGVPYGFKYSSFFGESFDDYYYMYNLQGDVVGIMDSTGTVIGNYTYDAWGNPVTTSTNSVLAMNPFRYRGYMYDAETGLYYLQSRYYDPATGRFINADSAECLGANETILSYNLYTYCENNPVNKSDPTGYLTISRGWLAFSLDLILSVVAPMFSGPLDIFGRSLKAIANRKNITLIWDKLLYGIVPKFTGLYSRVFTAIRTAIWRATGSLISNSTTSGIGYSIGKLLGRFRNANWNNMFDLVSCFFSAGSMIAGFLDYMDGSFNGKVRLF